MRHLTWILALLLCAGNIAAQTPTADPSSEVLQSCFLGTPSEVWTKLDLSRDQMKRLGRIQEACKEECDVPGVKKVADPISHSDGSMVMTELKNILTMDQYRAWLAYCQGSGDELAPK